MSGAAAGTDNPLLTGSNGNAGGWMDTGAGVAHPNSQIQHKASAVNMTAN